MSLGVLKVTLDASPSSLADPKVWSEAQKLPLAPFLCFRPSRLVPPMPLCFLDPVLGQIKELFNKAAVCSPTPDADDCKVVMDLTSLANHSERMEKGRMEDFNDALGSYLSFSVKQGVLCGATTATDSCLVGASGLKNKRAKA